MLINKFDIRLFLRRTQSRAVQLKKTVKHIGSYKSIGQSLRRRWNRSAKLKQVTRETPLMKAARLGDLAAVEELLTQNADPNAQNSLGRTALHLAASRSQEQVAAYLLAHGASHTLTDQYGYKPLGIDFISPETLHSIRQRYHRLRVHLDIKGQTQEAQIEHWSSELEHQGIIKLSDLIRPNSLSHLQTDFQAFVQTLQDKVARGEGSYRHYDEEEHWWESDKAFISNNAFKYSSQLVQLCCNETLLKIISHYLGKASFIRRGVAMRYLPSESKNNDMFGWHHDMEERQIKMMILLTDVNENDQCMSYILGSNRLFHPYKMFFQNRCSLDYCHSHLDKIEIYNTLGKAGDIFLFDSNGVHRGNRKPKGRVRDAFFIEYTADKSDVWGGDIPRNSFHKISLEGTNVFEPMMAVKKKWEQPKKRNFPTWIENLPLVQAWL